MRRIASLAKRWPLGTHQGSVDEAHLQSYLNEFAFRFNRRRSTSRGMVFYRVLELTLGHDPVRYRDFRPAAQGHPPRLRPGPAATHRAWTAPSNTPLALLTCDVRSAEYPRLDLWPPRCEGQRSRANFLFVDGSMVWVVIPLARETHEVAEGWLAGWCPPGHAPNRPRTIDWLKCT